MTLDYYEIRARLLAIIVPLLPLSPPAYALGFLSLDCTWKTIAGSITLVVLFLLSFVVRKLGKKIEEQLWFSWGGPPSTLLLLPDNPRLSAEMKQRIYKCVLENTGINIYPPTEIDPDWEGRAWDAFSIARNVTRRNDPKGVWFPHLAYYGLFRNLLGACPLMHKIALFSVGCSLGMYLESASRQTTLLICVIVGIIFATLPWVLSRRVLPEATKDMAFLYAKQCWQSYEALTTNNERANPS